MTYATLTVDDERHVERFCSSFLGVLASAVVTSGGRHVGVTNELLHNRDVDSSIEEIRNTAPAEVVW